MPLSRSVSRGRTMSRGSRGSRSTSSYSRSRSSGSTLVDRSNRTDGNTRRGWATAQSMSKFFDPFPRTMRAVLRYSQNVNLDATSGIPVHHLFRAGSIFDPDYTGVGHQPYGHDTYQQIFNHYRVIKSICRITNGSSGANNIMGISLTDDVTVSTDPDTVREVKPSKFINLGGSTEPHSLSMVYVSGQAFPYQGQATTALFGNNPAEEMYFDVWTQGNLPNNNPAALAITVCIEYYCEFSELKDLGPS